MRHLKTKHLAFVLGLALASPALADAPKAEESRWLAEGASVSAGTSAQTRAQEARVTERPFVEPFHRQRPSPSAQGGSGGPWPGAPAAAKPEAPGGLWPEVD